MILAHTLGVSESLTYKTLDQVETCLLSKGIANAAEFTLKHLHDGKYSVQEVPNDDYLMLKLGSLHWNPVVNASSTLVNVVAIWLICR